MEKIKKIKLLIIDIDGTLTNGIIYYGTGDMQMRGFHVQDGLGIKLLQRSGVEVAVISAKQSDILTRRMNDLNIKHAMLGYEHKVPAYEALKKTLQLSDEEIAYMGDDLPDLPILMRAGFAVSVPNSTSIIHKHVDYISKKEAGHGAVREVCELIMSTQGTLEKVLAPYLKSAEVS